MYSVRCSGALGLAWLCTTLACQVDTALQIGRYEASTSEAATPPASTTSTSSTQAPSDTTTGPIDDTSLDLDDGEPGTSSQGSEGSEDSPTRTARDGSVCETPSQCIDLDPCQQATCTADGECNYRLSDALCPDDEMCTLAGCRARTPSCEDRYGDALIFCDDFEWGLSWNWSSADAVGIDAAPPGRDSVVARVHTTGPNQRSTLQLQLPNPIDSGTLAIRSFVYVETSSEIDEGVAVYTLTDLPADDPALLSLHLQPAQGLLALNRISNESFAIAPALVPGQWHCLEFRVVIEHLEGTITVLVNDLPMIESSFLDTKPYVGVSLLGVGLQSGRGDLQPVELLLDDVVFATAPIGCD